MPSSASRIARVWTRGWAAVVSDRLRFLRLVTLLLALFTLYGIALTFGTAGDSPRAHLGVLASLLGLTALWTLGFRRGGLSFAWLPLELGLLLLYLLLLSDDFGPFGVFFLALQHRTLYGDRWKARTIAAAYGAVFLLGEAALPSPVGSSMPVVILLLMIGAAGSYMMFTLGTLLARDAERERLLRDSEARFRSVTHCLREALIIADTSERIILTNARVREVLGYEPDDLVGRSADVLLPEGSKTVFRDRIRGRLTGATELYETELVRKDGGTITAEISASPYRDESGAIVGTLGAISDVSDRKRLEERVRQALRLEAVGQLAGGVAHDFNNLLTVIKCHTELLLSDASADVARDGLQEIDRAADRGARLVGQLLAFSRRQMLQPRRVTLARVVAEALPVLRSLIRSDIELVVCPAQQAEAIADPLRVEQALVTMVRNAVDALPAGGRITIETLSHDIDPDDPRVRTQEVGPGMYAVLTVRDNGVGMTPDVQQRLFEPFFSTKAPGAGSGLGLAGMYGVVRQSGGFVEVSSRPGEGSTFRVFLPSVAREPRPVERARGVELQPT